jgi:Uma2 family endonuclease
MVNTAIAEPKTDPKVDLAISPTISSTNAQKISLDEWAIAPPSDGREWVDGNLKEKTGMTLQHSRVQGRVVRLWGNHSENNKIGGEVYTEVPCRTLEQGRRPDVAYLTPDLLAKYGDLPTLPQSFPLIAEIISPTDSATEVFAKAYEYLRSGCREVWLIFGEDRTLVVFTEVSRMIYVADEVVTSLVLDGFSITVNALLGLEA